MTTPVVDAAEASTGALTLNQRAMLTLEELSGGPVYPLTVMLSFDDALDIDVLAQAVAGVVGRHESLRTVLVDDETPTRVLTDGRDVTLAVQHARSCEQRERHVLATREELEPFGHVPPVRFKLVRVPDGGDTLVFGIHHVFADGWSVGIILAELAETYTTVYAGAELDAGTAPGLDTLVRIEAERMAAGDFAREDIYWRGRLHDAPGSPPLPTTLPSVSHRRRAGDQVQFALSRPTDQAVRTLAAQLGITQFVIFCAAEALVVALLTDSEGATLGAAMHGRSHPDLEGIVAPCTNITPVPIRVQDDLSVAAWLRRLRAEAVESLAHHETPFAYLVSSLRSHGMGIVVEKIRFAIGVHDQLVPARVMFGPVEGRFGDLGGGGGSPFDLTVFIQSNVPTLRGALEYDVEMMTRAEAEATRDLFCTALRELVVDPDRRVADVRASASLSRAELSQIPSSGKVDTRGIGSRS